MDGLTPVTECERRGRPTSARLHKKGGKRHDVPADHRAEEALEADNAGRGGRCPRSDAFLAYGGEHAPAVARQVSRTG